MSHRCEVGAAHGPKRVIITRDCITFVLTIDAISDCTQNPMPAGIVRVTAMYALALENAHPSRRSGILYLELPAS